MRCPARRWMPEGGVSAAFSLTRKLSSSRPLSSARIAVITLVVLAGGSGSGEAAEGPRMPTGSPSHSTCPFVGRHNASAPLAQRHLARQVRDPPPRLLDRELEDPRQPAKGLVPGDRDEPIPNAPFPRHLM